MPIAHFASNIDASIATIRRQAAKLGLPAVRPRESYERRSIEYPKEFSDKIVFLLSKGLTSNVIAMTVGCTEYYVKTINSKNKSIHVSSLDNQEISETDFNTNSNPIINEAYVDGKILQAINQGASYYAKIAEITGFTVYLIKKRMSDPSGPKFTNQTYASYDKIPNAIKQQIYEMSQNGSSIESIRKELNVSSRLITKIRKDNNLERNIYRSIPSNKTKEFIEYSKQVRRLSQIIRRYMKMEYMDSMCWDHKLSVVDCFLHNVPIDIAASVENMELLSNKENASKHAKSSITVDELYRLRGAVRPDI